MYRLDLNEQEHSLLQNMIVLAADKYRENAQHFRDIKPQLEKDEAENPDALRLVHSSICDGMAEQFDRQEADARALLDKISEAEEM